ncbi:MAG TPA: sporulation integral membrane protein YtvI [Firmicutes bacterium]|nr:sporulation integral membrane protein YtvI [Candidatus Fermentithermobacillaceae bacterium]
MNRSTLAYLSFLFIGIYIFLRFFLPHILPFAIGVFLAFLLDPAVSFISRRLRVSRGFSAFLVLLLLLGSTGFFLTWGIARIASELSDLYGYFPQYYGEFTRIMGEVLRVAGEVSQRLPEPLARVAQDQWNRLYSVLSRAVSGAGSLVRGVPGFSITMIFTILSTYFMIKDRAAIGAFLRSIVPPKAFDSFKNVEVDILTGVAGFVRAQVLLVLLTMVVNVIGLSVLNTRYAVALGLLLAILDILPIVGPGLVYFPWILYHLVWGNVATGVGLAVLYAGVSFLRQVVQTHLVGREMGLHPLVTLISLYIGFRLFGAPGLVYGPLVAILVKGLWASGIIPHEGGAEN